MNADQKLTLNKPVFFYVCEQSFSHLSICLAEGFKELGIPFYSNINYWKLSEHPDKYLFEHNPDITPDDCSIVVLDTKWLHSKGDFPENFFHPGRQYITVYLDEMDGLTIWNPPLEQFDLRLRTHYNQRSKHPENCVSWVFGLSNRIIEQTQDYPQFQERQSSIIFNFRVEQDQIITTRSWFKFEAGFSFLNSGLLVFENPVRRISKQQILPLFQGIFNIDDRIDQFDQPPSDSYHALQWEQTGKRHHPQYYKRLKESVACAGFAGCVIPWSNSGESLVEWWDSWRFWESLAAGCVTFHVDFDKYAIDLPVMPENWRHYIGIDLDNPQATVDRIINEPQILEKISTEGRQWAIEHYSPVPTALRFLEIVIAYQKNQKDRLEICNLSITEPQINLPLRDRNLIIFPDWSQSEISLITELKQIIKSLITHPHKEQITLLIDNSNTSDETANLILSSIAINLLMEEELEIDEGPEIALIGQLSPIQWQALVSHLTGRIKLEHENQEAIASVGAEIIPVYDLDN